MCALCPKLKNHSIFECKEMSDENSISDKFTAVRRAGLCFYCLKNLQDNLHAKSKTELVPHVGVSITSYFVSLLSHVQ